jgi:hypothetical protein
MFSFSLKMADDAPNQSGQISRLLMLFSAVSRDKKQNYISGCFLSDYNYSTNVSDLFVDEIF